MLDGQSTLVPSARCAISLLDCRDLVAAGADDRLDKLTVGVLVSAIDELGERVRSIRAFVVHARKVERTERIVGRPDHEQPGEAACELLDDVADVSALERGELFARAATKIRRVPALSSCGRAAGDAETSTSCSAPAAAISSTSREARPADRRRGASRRARHLRPQTRRDADRSRRERPARPPARRAGDRGRRLPGRRPPAAAPVVRGVPGRLKKRARGLRRAARTPGRGGRPYRGRSAAVRGIPADRGFQ